MIRTPVVNAYEAETNSMAFCSLSQDEPIPFVVAALLRPFGDSLALSLNGVKTFLRFLPSSSAQSISYSAFKLDYYADLSRQVAVRSR